MPKNGEFLDVDVLREKIVTAALFLLAYERVKKNIVGYLESLFSDSYQGGVFVVGNEYKRQVLGLSTSGKVHASLLWFRNQNAISDDDFTLLVNLKTLRDEIAHDLFGVIASDGNIENLRDSLSNIHMLSDKIAKWWIVNIESAIAPENFPEEFDESAIQTGSDILLTFLHDVAMGDSETLQKYKELFEEYKSGDLPRVKVKF